MTTSLASIEKRWPRAASARRPWLCLAVLSLPLWGCVADGSVEEGEGDDTEQAVIGATTNTAPSFSTQANGTFRMFGLPGSNPPTMDRTIRRVAFIRQGYGEQDLAVAELDADVPASFAKPLDYAVAEPANNERVTAYGYG